MIKKVIMLSLVSMSMVHADYTVTSATATANAGTKKAATIVRNVFLLEEKLKKAKQDALKTLLEMAETKEISSEVFRMYMIDIVNSK